MSKKKTKEHSYVPVTPGGTVLLELQAHTEKSAWQNLLQSINHRPLGDGTEKLYITTINCNSKQVFRFFANDRAMPLTDAMKMPKPGNYALIKDLKDRGYEVLSTR